MKTITLNGKKTNVYRPHEAGEILGFHDRTIKRFIREGKLKAMNSNPNGKQPVWWITEQEIKNYQKLSVNVKFEKKKSPQKKKSKTSKRKV